MDDARAVRRRYVVCSDNAPPTDLFPGFDGGIVVEALISNPHEFTTEICAHECGVFRIMTKNCSQPRRGEQISFALQFDNRVLHARLTASATLLQCPWRRRPDQRLDALQPF